MPAVRSLSWAAGQAAGCCGLGAGTGAGAACRALGFRSEGADDEPPDEPNACRHCCWARRCASCAAVSATGQILMPLDKCTAFHAKRRLNGRPRGIANSPFMVVRERSSIDWVMMSYESIVPAGLPLGSSRQFDGAVLDDSNSLAGHAAGGWGDELEKESNSESGLFCLGDDIQTAESELVEALAELALLGVVLAADVAVPHLKERWDESRACSGTRAGEVEPSAGARELATRVHAPCLNSREDEDPPSANDPAQIAAPDAGQAPIASPAAVAAPISMQMRVPPQPHICADSSLSIA